MGRAPQNKKNRFGSNKEKRHFLSRNQCLRILQISLSEFRRLCILKGIYPHVPAKEPGQKQKGIMEGKVYFLTKDIRYLQHDPLIEKMRGLKVFVKKLKKAKAKDEKEHQKSLMTFVRPHFTYDHIIKERYPSFLQALSDLDDSLTLCWMFTKLPAADDIQRREITNCVHLCQEFATFVSKTRALRKVFLTVKGIYYQASILGVKITWLTPFDFPQQVPQQVDFKVFKSFLTFYQTLMTFVNFKLFDMMKRSYPPKYPKTEGDVDMNTFLLHLEEDVKKPKLTKEELAKQQETAKRISTLDMNQIVKKEKKSKKPVPQPQEEEVDLDDDEKADLPEPIDESDPTKLFKGLTFYISRETPKASLEFVIKSFSGNVSWKENDERITHHILDRELTDKKQREYIQPQWVYDCVNHSILLPVHKYAPGVKLPPHLSPFVQAETTHYVPEYQEEIDALKGKDKESEEEIDEDEQEEEVNTKHLENLYQREIQAEMQGKKFATVQQELQKEGEKREELKKFLPYVKKTSKERKEEEDRRLRATMLKPKDKRIYNAKLRHDKRMDEAANSLRVKREKIKAAEGTGEDWKKRKIEGLTEPKNKKKKL